MCPGSSSSSGNEDDANEGPAEVEGAFKSSGTAEREGPADMGATAVTEIDTDIQHDAQAQFERVQKALKEGHDDKVGFFWFCFRRYLESTERVPRYCTTVCSLLVINNQAHVRLLSLTNVPLAKFAARVFLMSGTILA